MKYTEILKRNRELESDLVNNKYKIAIISNIVVTQLKEILEFSLRVEGINAEVLVGDYDAIVQDSVRFSELDAILVFWEAGNLVDGFHNTVSILQPEELDALVDRVEGEIDLVLRSLRSTPLVLMNRFSSMVFDTEILRDGAFKKFCRRLNDVLESATSLNKIIVDLDAILAEVGLSNAVDFRQFQSGKALYSIEFFKAYAEAVRPAFMAAAGRSKKVIVLDCDNTLWHGTLGEAGIAGIQMGNDSSRGKPFWEVQTILRGLQREGVLLALCSKNNPSDVDAVLSDHPDMVLKDEDLVAKMVNWQDKATNLRELALDLNLGLDSFVFLDDSAFELGLIQKELPQVRCIAVPQRNSEYPALVRTLWRDFFSLSKAPEDKHKTIMYRQERQRKKEATKFESIDEYLSSLRMELKIYWDDQISVARASQLTQKTNQFNLTTRRYSEAEIQGMLEDPNYMLAVFSVSDRYGNYGVTGMTIIRRGFPSTGQVFIDSLLMSCRVIGRNIEYVFFDQIVQKLRGEGWAEIRAEFLATKKNSLVERFYDDLGFNVVSDDENHREYAVDLMRYESSGIEYISADEKGK